MSGDDGDIAPAAVRGDQAAFEVVFERHARAVFRVCQRRTGSLEDAEDALSATFLQAWRLRAQAVLVEGSLRPWLLAIAVNVMRNGVRGERRRVVGLRRLEAVAPSSVLGPESAVVDALAAARDAAIVEEGIRRLPEGERVVVELCLLEGLSIAAAATALAIREGTVRSRLFRARGRLRALLQPGEAREQRHGSGHHQGEERRPAVRTIDVSAGRGR